MSVLDDLAARVTQLEAQLRAQQRTLPAAGLTVTGLVASDTPWSTGDVKLWLGDPGGTSGVLEPELGWLLLNGATPLRNDYPDLWAWAQANGLVGKTFTAGDGITTFGLLDTRNRVIVGQGAGIFATLGALVGEQTHTLTLAELAAHGHPLSDPGHSHGASWNPNGYTPYTGGSGDIASAAAPYVGGDWWRRESDHADVSISAAGTGISISNAGGGGAHNNVQQSVVLSFLCKY